MTTDAPARVLLVDDELALARLYVRALVASGYQVDHAVDGADGLARLVGRTYDVVVSDVCMPRMSGLELLVALRQKRLDIPVILMTAQLDVKTYARARELGTVRYLLKPVGLEKLAKAVDNAVKLRAVLVRSHERRSRTRPAT